MSRRRDGFRLGHSGMLRIYDSSSGDPSVRPTPPDPNPYPYPYPCFLRRASDQGFLNAFYPYFAACPLFEPYPTRSSRLAIARADQDAIATAEGGGRNASAGDSERGAGRALSSEGAYRGRGCKRLPSRYNGDWPLLFVDGDVQVSSRERSRVTRALTDHESGS